MEVKKVAEEWEIWDEEEEAAKSEEEAKKLVPEKFHRWIKVFGKKQLERMPTRKLWDHAIDMKEGFMPEKRESVPFVKRRKRGSEGVCKGAIEERIYLAIKVTTNGAGVLRRKEGWEEENGPRLSLS